jgi:hypothetical protein
VAIADSELAQITARAGVGRAGTMRAGVTANADHLKADGSGEIIWNRPPSTDGDPAVTSDTYTTVRE